MFCGLLECNLELQLIIAYGFFLDAQTPSIAFLCYPIFNWLSSSSCLLHPIQYDSSSTLNTLVTSSTSLYRERLNCYTLPEQLCLTLLFGIFLKISFLNENFIFIHLQLQYNRLRKQHAAFSRWYVNCNVVEQSTDFSDGGS